MKKFLKAAAMVFIATAQMTGTARADKRVLPEVLREFHSPSNEFRLLIIGNDRWLKPYASAELYRVNKSDSNEPDSNEPGSSDELLWRISKLPHRLGPSNAFVTDGGRVLLIDEWVNTPSSYALMVIEKNGETKPALSFAEIARLTGNSEASMVKSAVVGAWQSMQPSLVPGKERVRLRTCSTPFYLDLSTGEVHFDATKSTRRSNQ